MGARRSSLERRSRAPPGGRLSLSLSRSLAVRESRDRIFGRVSRAKTRLEPRELEGVGDFVGIALAHRAAERELIVRHDRHGLGEFEERVVVRLVQPEIVLRLPGLRSGERVTAGEEGKRALKSCFRLRVLSTHENAFAHNSASHLSLSRGETRRFVRKLCRACPGRRL